MWSTIRLSLAASGLDVAAMTKMGTKKNGPVCTNWVRARRVYGDDETVEVDRGSDVTGIANENSRFSRYRPQRYCRNTIAPRLFGTWSL